MQQSKKVNVRYITFTAVMAALVFVFTFTFKIPLGTGYTHLGDMMIFLAAWLLGGKKAAPAAGTGNPDRRRHCGCRCTGRDFNQERRRCQIAAYGRRRR